MAPTVDDEILALAGGMSDSDNGEASDQGARTASRRKAKSKPTSARKKRRVQDADSSDDDANASDMDQSDGDGDNAEADSGAASYPIEGVYKSWEDKQRIESLPVIERESIIAQRRDEILSKERTAQLAGMVAAQQGRRGTPSSAPKSRTSAATSRRKAPVKKTKKKAADSDMEDSEDEEDEEEDDDDDEDEADDDDDAYDGPATSRGARKIKSVGSSDTRNKKLQELSENRRKKAAGRKSANSPRQRDGKSPSSSRRKHRSSSDDSDDASSESEGYVDSDDDYARRRGRLGRASRYQDDGPFVPPALDDLNRARIGREDILRIMYRKNWQDKLIGTFVRVVVDPKKDERTGQMIPRYRVYEVIDWKKGNKWYAVDTGKYTQTLLVLAFAKEKHTKEIIYVSNSSISEEEYQRYNLQAQEASRRPSKSHVIEQAEEFNDYINEPWTEETFAHVLKERKAAQEAAERAQKEKAKGDGGEAVNGSAGAGASMNTPRNGTPSAAAEVKSENQLLAELNERNRRADRERIQEANRRQAELRRAAALAQAQAAQAQRDKGEGSSSSSSAAVVNGRGIAGASTAPKKAAVQADFDLGDF